MLKSKSGSQSSKPFVPSSKDSSRSSSSSSSTRNDKYSQTLLKTTSNDASNSIQFDHRVRLVEVKITVLRLTGLLSETAGPKKKKTSSNNNLPVDGEGDDSPVVSAFVLFSRDDLDGGTSSDTYVTSRPLKESQSLYDGKHRHIALWPVHVSKHGCESATDEEQCTSSFCFSRVMGKENYNDVVRRKQLESSDASSVAVADCDMVSPAYVPEFLDMKVGVVRNGRRIVLGTSTLVVSGDMLPDTELYIPVRPRSSEDGESPTTNTLLGKLEKNFSRRSQGSKWMAFPNDSSRSMYCIDDNSSLLIRLEVLPTDSNPVIETRDDTKHSKSISETSFNTQSTELCSTINESDVEDYRDRDRYEHREEIVAVMSEDDSLYQILGSGPVSIDSGRNVRTYCVEVMTDNVGDDAVFPPRVDDADDDDYVLTNFQLVHLNGDGETASGPPSPDNHSDADAVENKWSHSVATMSGISTSHSIRQVDIAEIATRNSMFVSSISRDYTTATEGDADLYKEDTNSEQSSIDTRNTAYSSRRSFNSWNTPISDQDSFDTRNTPYYSEQSSIYTRNTAYSATTRSIATETSCSSFDDTTYTSLSSRHPTYRRHRKHHSTSSVLSVLWCQDQNSCTDSVGSLEEAQTKLRCHASRLGVDARDLLGI